MSGINGGDTQEPWDVISKGKGKDLKRGFAVELLSPDAVDVRKDQVNSVLVEGIKAGAFREDVPEDRVVFLDMRFLVGAVGVTEEEIGFFGPVRGVFDREDIGELSAIVREEEGEDGSEGTLSAGEAFF